MTGGYISIYTDRQTELAREDKQEEKAVRRGHWPLLRELECELQPISAHCTPLLERGEEEQRDPFQSEEERALQSQVQLTP